MATAVSKMTSAVARLYVLALAVVTFFVVWATVAAHPWAAPKTAAADPRIHAIALRQQHLRAESLRVKRMVDARWARYRRQLAAHKTAAAQLSAATPSVRVVNLPALVVTRTS